MGSGSTCTAMLIADATLHLAWVGDSTAVLASEETEGTVTAQPLTSDHKPDDELVRAPCPQSGRVAVSNGVQYLD